MGALGRSRKLSADVSFAAEWVSWETAGPY